MAFFLLFVLLCFAGNFANSLDLHPYDYNDNGDRKALSSSINKADTLGFGHSIDFSGAATNLIVGDPHGNFGGTKSGYIKIYTRVGTTWTNVFQLNGNEPADLLGYSVAFAGDGNTYAVAGAPGHNDEQGNVYLMSFASDTWSNTENLADLDIIPKEDDDGDALYQLLGFSLSGSRATGNTFIAGAPAERAIGNAYILRITSSTAMSLLSTIAGNSVGDETGYLVSASQNGFWFAASVGQTSFKTMKCTTVTNCESEPTLTVEFQGNLTKSTSLSIDQVENTGPTVVVSGTGTNGIQTGIGVVQFYGCDNVEGLCLGLQGQYVDDCSDNLFGFSSVVSQTTIGVGSPNWDGKGEVFLFEGYEFELIENREDFAGEDCGEQIGRSIAIASTDDGLTFVAAGGNGYVRVW
eukprot:CAMPEP_0178962920 /NCGR_PEP_ID=MMETSP0789-20121207/14681_1 /TAXON_ID=3005 /ORGANISM="Rhizosolenia setigera, Strain CCMP 1694" /LENGTH=407 /DNA_ID=CAMNT_0020647221 /DNA_START=99 /DNA_END=1319 /DNA_ORIENTATION=+